MFLDLDHFKEVNDTLGHAAGDAVLRRVASVMKADLRDSDVLARMGGDEFVALLVESGPEATARAVANLRRRLLAAMAAMDSPVTFSIGVVSFKRPPDSVHAMVEAADQLMYSVKREGRNAICHEVAEDAS
jgi:diguanylate cyclase (GGDEF)-like protein